MSSKFWTFCCMDALPICEYFNSSSDRASDQLWMSWQPGLDPGHSHVHQCGVDNDIVCIIPESLAWWLMQYYWIDFFSMLCDAIATSLSTFSLWVFWAFISSEFAKMGELLGLKFMSEWMSNCFQSYFECVCNICSAAFIVVCFHRTNVSCMLLSLRHWNMTEYCRRFLRQPKSIARRDYWKKYIWQKSWYTIFFLEKVFQAAMT